MSSRPTLSKGETDIARAIWNLGEATVGQVFDLLSEQKEIDYSTVQTYIRRLEAKGYIAARRVGRNKIYRPKIRPGKVIGEAVDDLTNRLFDGEVLSLMRHLINDRGIDDADLRELRKMIDSASEVRDSVEGIGAEGNVAGGIVAEDGVVDNDADYSEKDGADE